MLKWCRKIKCPAGTQGDNGGWQFQCHLRQSKGKMTGQASILTCGQWNCHHWRQKDWSFYWPAREYQKMLWHSSSRNCKSKKKRRDALVQKSPRIWVWIACCFHIKNWSGHSHLCQVGHHKIILASGFCLPGVQFSSRWYLCTQGEKTICTPPHLSEVFPQ